MNILAATVPNFLGGLAVLIVGSALTWVLARRANRPRRYTLLNSAAPDGSPIVHLTTRRAGTIIRRDVGRGPERFELTNVQLPDGTYAAEPIDRYVV
ncbi:hypothetical protein [Streptomyces sp. TLI_185]|uniref:hypothetical protein n=1 Tax=Streptomyces sp. TLI_185 TaxID=2485151 RepID=UPI000FBCAB04|nr:hypothetical protein [Streptomyces sp. TLI_185]RPF24724.1 hypothetical protein EDD92_9658 [Streptomyces sp. TLI_185]